jgi:hypothetical protein
MLKIKKNLNYYHNKLFLKKIKILLSKVKPFLNFKFSRDTIPLITLITSIVYINFIIYLSFIDVINL